MAVQRTDWQGSLTVCAECHEDIEGKVIFSKAVRVVQSDTFNLILEDEYKKPYCPECYTKLRKGYKLTYKYLGKLNDWKTWFTWEKVWKKI